MRNCRSGGVIPATGARASQALVESNSTAVTPTLNPRRRYAHDRRGSVRSTAGIGGAASQGERREHGGALVEMAFIGLPLAMLLLMAVDVGLRASYHNRLRSAAREGAIMAEYQPGLVSGCPAGIEDIEDRVVGHDPELSARPDWRFRVVSYPSMAELPRLCDTDGGVVGPGSKVAVEVEAEHSAISPFTRALFGETVTARAVVMVQG